MNPRIVGALFLATGLAALSTRPAFAFDANEFYGPAKKDYRAAPDDFKQIETALDGVLKMAPKLFPAGIGAVDVILQDTSDFYIYSRTLTYPYEKVKRWGQYQVYRLPHRRPEEHEMWGCAGGPPSAMEVDDRRIGAEHSIRCSPWGSFRAAQEKKKSDYRFVEAYHATLIHEFGHQYQEMMEMNPTPAMQELDARSAAVVLPEGVERGLMQREVFAEYCELKGAKALYPAHYRRMLKDAAGPTEKNEYGHHEALKVALDYLKAPLEQNEAPNRMTSD